MRRTVGILTIIFMAFLLSGGQVIAAPRLQEITQEEKVVVVIDPGHGGENLGTTQNQHTEKLMTMTTALAMYKELSLYDNVEVYLTHTEDRDLSLKERAEFAQSVKADFLFSIHYNASENHEMFGSEVWVSSVPPYNGYGYQFGYEILSDLRELGLLIRGVKTRFSSKGEDYYGIIRESVNLGIPAVIIEHCHVDEARDAVYCDSDEKLQEFGRMDARAAARYFGLKSSALGVDYSQYSLAEANTDSIVKETENDTTKPDMSRVTYSGAEDGSLTLTVTAADDDSPLLYYSYSLDGGKTFGPREAWPGSDTLTGEYEESFILHIEREAVPYTKPEVIVRAYNQYDLYTESNVCKVPILSEEMQSVEESDTGHGENGSQEEIEREGAGSEQGEDEDKGNIITLLAFCLGLASLLLIILTIMQGIFYHNHRKRRR